MSDKERDRYHVTKEGSVADEYGGILYDADSLIGIDRAGRERLAELHTENPGLEWEGTADVDGAWDILVREGHLKGDEQ